MKFDVKVALLCPPTAGLAALQKGLSEADLPLKKNVQKPLPKEPKRSDVAVGTKLRDCVKQSSDGIMRAARGRKALLLLTDGVDAGSRHTLDEAIAGAQRSETLVYSIRYMDPNVPDGRYAQKGLHILTELAGRTGGGFFTVSPELPLEKVLDRIQAELRTQYSIGFIPAAGNSGEYRKLSLTANQAGLTVRSRDGYYSK
jgi:Ca-activated chloride channel family protein